MQTITWKMNVSIHTFSRRCACNEIISEELERLEEKSKQLKSFYCVTEVVPDIQKIALSRSPSVSQPVKNIFMQN